MTPALKNVVKVIGAVIVLIVAYYIGFFILKIAIGLAVIALAIFLYMKYKRRSKF